MNQQAVLAASDTLQVVLHSSDSEWAVWLAAISASIAFVAAVAGPIATIRATGRQATVQEALARSQIAAAKEGLQAQLDVQIAANSAQLATAIDVATRQIRAQIVSSNRQAWINNLRDAVAESQATLTYVANGAYHDPQSSMSDLDVKAERALLQRARIDLFLNPQESDSRDLVVILTSQFELVDTMLEQRKLGVPAEAPVLLLLRNDLITANEEVVAITKRILKGEWGRVKTGD